MPQGGVIAQDVHVHRTVLDRRACRPAWYDRKWFDGVMAPDDAKHAEVVILEGTDLDVVPEVLLKAVLKRLFLHSLLFGFQIGNTPRLLPRILVVSPVIGALLNLDLRSGKDIRQRR